MQQANFSSGPTIRVVIADDHPVTLSGLYMLAQQCDNMVVTGLASSPGAIFELLVKWDCDVLVTDLSMPVNNEIDGMEMIRQIRTQFPMVAVVVLTAMKKASLYHALLTIGARAIVHKGGENSEIVEAINQACRGQTFLGKSCAELLKMRQLVTVVANDHQQNLTPREVEVLRYFSRGASARTISKRMGRSIKTISHHKRAAMEKLRLDNDLQLMRFLSDNGFEDVKN
ncbi:response regulator transcription factor [Glaciimonas immobilis]|uniref:Two-component system capsular synthesis response regulator RcsB n=1 Tax=Glaciimonas immobilis TaxID=728004 RepID=A0A840RNG9_9BURK|nr:response regulator transcription factor [Glaciimonas immobilis]KAF3998065.1 response regulator transcription factor [Glaciimonas immobilis]MBB5199245.1 two-component system capsular synthesis response regulator RcsB [Glaciimonas immobilis]